MPNHVDNYLEISGKPKMINKLMKQLEITDSEATKENGATIFSCHKVIPQPIFQGEEWYEWRIANWGSKWGAYDVAVTESDWESGNWALFFSTAWSPITQVIAEMSKQHPTLRLHYRYYEGGADYWGKETYEGGKLSLEESGELSTASCDIRTEAYGDEHHWCRLCSNNYSCNGNDELCDTCLEEELKLNNELLDETGETNDESNFVSIRDNN